jgi:hypothetical protein
MFGPHEGPRTDPMQFFVEYTPTYSEHINSSELCATCHTVIIPVVEGGEHVGDFVEQAPYFEWLNSSLGSTSCRTCHLPVVDATGAALATPIATYPEALPTREPFGVHSFEGANAYMLTMLSENVEWTGADVSAGELQAAAARSLRHLETAATLDVSASSTAGGARGRRARREPDSAQAADRVPGAALVAARDRQGLGGLHGVRIWSVERARRDRGRCR